MSYDQSSLERRAHLNDEVGGMLSMENTAIPEHHREELDRRLAAADADPGAGRPWEEVKERLHHSKRS